MIKEKINYSPLLFLMIAFILAAFEANSQSCNVPNGVKISTKLVDGQSSVLLNWYIVQGIESYEVAYKVSDGSSWETAIVSTNSFKVENLAQRKSYDWKVKSNCSSTESSVYSTVKSIYLSDADGTLSTYENQFITLRTKPTLYSHETQGDFLYVIFKEKYVREGLLDCTFYNWKKEIIQTVSLAKHLGSNHYKLDLKSLSNEFKKGEIYTIETRDYRNIKHFSRFKYTSKPAGPVIDLIVNPISTSCEITADNEVEFYVDIIGGTAGYSINWTVSNDAEGNESIFSKDEYAEKTANVQIMGTAIYVASKITVTKTLNYYVTVIVTDLCGNKEKKVVRISCEEDESSQNIINNTTNTTTGG